MNIDGDVLPAKKIATIATVIKDDNGSWPGGVIAKNEFCMVLMAKLWVINYGMKLVWEKGGCHLVVDTDNKMAVRLIQTPHEQANIHYDLVRGNENDAKGLDSDGPTYTLSD